METRKRLIEFTRTEEIEMWFDEYPSLEVQHKLLEARPARAFRLEFSKDGGETWQAFYTIKGEDF